MSKFFSNNFKNLTPYTPGEQPQERKYIKLNTNESPFPPSPIAQRMAREEAGNLQLYSDPEVGPLKKMAAQKFGVPEECLIFSNGSDELINFAVKAFCDDEHTLIFPDITYGFYSVYANLNHIPYTEKPLREDFTIDTSDYTNCGKTVLLANPNAITGVALPLTEIENIVKTNPGNVVIIDEAYVDFGGESALPLIEKYDNLLVIGTLSKSRSLAGARVGFAAGSKELIKDLNTIRYSIHPYNVNRMSMQAAVGALADEDYFKRNCEKIKANRAYTVSELKRLGFTMTDSSANFILAKTDKMSGLKLYQTLKENGILVRHFETPRLSPYNRITIGSAEEMAAFIETLEKILP